MLDSCSKRRQMLKIQRSSNGQVVFRIIGRMEAERIAELKALLKSETGAWQIFLDLRDLTLVDRDAVRFLESCEEDGIKLKNCPAYIREWITRERGGR
jgi:anti-anti-sigma regulatory factor